MEKNSLILELMIKMLTFKQIVLEIIQNNVQTY